MKNTKKILMILVACVLLVGTAFACIASAADYVTAGSATTIDEYLNFKRVTYDNMEAGSHPSFTQIGNLAKIRADYKKFAEGMYFWNEYRQGTPGIYDAEDSVSNWFYVLDYNYNVMSDGKGADLYVEPQLGVLNNIDKTPTKGFISEFDIAFFSPLQTIYDETKPVLDEEGNPTFDEEGNPIYEAKMRSVLERVVENGKVQWITYTDENGETVREPKLAPIWIAATDDSGKAMFYEGGEPVMVPVYDKDGRIQLDEDKKVILVQGTDEKTGEPLVYAAGDPVMKVKETELQEQLPYEAMNQTFYVLVLNSGTIKDGQKRVLEFKHVKDEETGEIKITVSVPSNLDEGSKATTFYLTPDEWSHFTVQYVAETMMTYVYLGDDTGDGRVLIGQVNGTSPAENSGGAEVPVYPLRFRMGSSGSQSGIVGLDNFVAYQGITVHDPDFITKMEDADPDALIKYFVSVLTNESGTNTAASRLYAYDDITEYVIKEYYDNGQYTSKTLSDSKIKAAVDKYLDYVRNTDGIYTELVALAKVENASVFADYVTKADKPERKLSNTKERSEKIAVAEEFLAAKGALIDREGDVFSDADAILRALKTAVTADDAATEFIHYMNLFNESVKYNASVSRIESHVNAAAAIYYATIQGADYSDLNANDLKSLNNAIATFVGDSASGKLSAEQVITQNTAEWNSERFIGIVELIKGYGISDEVFAADDGTIRTLWKLAREILRGTDGVVDKTYEGFPEANATFEQIHAYFWIATQSEHIDAIGSKLDTFNDASLSYVAKKAICKYVEKYVAANEAYIDFENENIVALLNRNETYEKQLESLETDYENLLTQNIIKFVNLVAYMQELDGYAAIKAYFDEATDYYYSMDLVYDMDGDGANDVDIDGAVAAYESLRQYLSDVEADCATFVAATAALSKATDTSEVYVALVACYGSLTHFDETYEGAAAAKAIYDAKYAEYTNEATVVIEHISETTELVCSTRGNWGFDNIVAFVRNLFK